MKNLKNVLWGTIFVIVGVILAINALDIADIDIFFDGWWTLIIIIPCFINLFSDDDKEGSIIGLIVGVVLLLSCLDMLDFKLVWKLLVPVILIIIGLSFIFKNTLFENRTRHIKEKNNKTSNLNATFSSQKLNYDNEEFKGCNIDAVFGGVDIDLRNAKINKDVIINATSIFGGIDIHVPSDVKVKISSNAIFGGCENKTKNKNKDGEYTIYINATCLFGGVEIR